jgi:hypothetical protein
LYLLFSTIFSFLFPHFPKKQTRYKAFFQKKNYSPFSLFQIK